MVCERERTRNEGALITAGVVCLGRDDSLTFLEDGASASRQSLGLASRAV